MKFCYLIFNILTVLFTVLCETEKIRYISTEHPHVDYINPKYVSYCNVTARRYGRHDPYYYVGISLKSIYESKNNVTVHFYFYEFLTNRYRRGFVEMHFLLCDLIEKDNFFGTAIRQALHPLRKCPFPAGEYSLANMTIPNPSIPKNFPFTKGRIYANVTSTKTEEMLLSAYIDMEIKETRIRNLN